jgi:hypothetical protein
MSLNLLNSFGKRGVSYGLLTKKADVVDTDYLSKYFVVSDFESRFTSGKNTISLNGSNFLMQSSDMIMECLDSAGNNLYIEMAKTTDVSAQTYAYKEASSYIFSIHVYGDISDGVGKLIVYGTLADGRSVKWIRNITIDKSLKNVSKVRFYQRPSLEVSSIQVPVLSTTISNNLIVSKQFSGSIHGLAVSPPKDTNLSLVNRRNIDINYQLVIDSPSITSSSPEVNACNTQMIGSTVDIVIDKIQKPFSTDEVSPTNPSSSFIISDVYNNKTLLISDPYYYTDTKNNSVITNISSASVLVSYPFVSYNTTTASYLTTTIDGVVSIVKQSYADITYRNIRTFSGYLARHKIYRKSLLSNADFEIVADEPLFINEVLADNLTQNKYYDKLGVFYNSDHIARYWFTSSNNLSIQHTPNVFANSMFISSSNPNNLIGEDYIMVKNDSVTTNRNAVYLPYTSSEFLATSGSSYDSNFMSFKANVQYLIEVSAMILKEDATKNAGLELYLTSSLAAALKESSYTTKHGIRLATVHASADGINKNIVKQIYFFTPSSDLYGTLIVVPYRCQSYLKNISVRVYGDDGFSPDVFSTRIPWVISVAGESFEIKSELFDINHKLVYSDLRVLQNFDPSGSSLIPYIPGTGGFVPGTNDFFVSGSLIVSKSIEVQTGNIAVDVGNIVIDQGSLYIPSITARTVISQSRVVSVRGDGINSGQLVFTPIVDIDADDKWIYMAKGSAIDHTSTVGISTKKSIAAEYGTTAGRKVYWNGSNVRVTETGSSIYI